MIRPPSVLRNSVYLLRCRKCPVVYIGETGRSFWTRINDHVSSYANRNLTKSAFSRHLIDHDHLRDDKVILHYEDGFCRRLVLENIEVVKHNNRDDVNLVNTTSSENGLVKEGYSTSLFYNCAGV